MPKRHSDKRSTEATLEWRPVESVIPYARNPRLISETAISKVAGSIAEFGFRQPIVVDGEGIIIVGHTRLYAAQRLGLETVPVLVAADLSPAQVKAYRIADNRTGQEAEWDLSLLSLEFEDLAAFDFDVSLTGFEPSELVFGDEASDIVEDEAPEPPEEPVTKPGDVWLLGEHRVMCGDSTDGGSVALLMAGAKAEMFWTDPPYGVAIGDKNKLLNAIGPSNRIEENLANDTLDDAGLDEMLRAAFAVAATACLAGAAWYVAAPAGPLHLIWGKALKDMGIWHQTLQWVKNNATFSPMGVDYHWRAEPIFYGWLPGAAHRYHGGRKQDTVWEIDRPTKSPDHPTMKPVELVARAVENSSSAGDIVLDLFLGSGTTLIAAEQTGRICYGMEVDPRYCDVIVKRWEAFTGKKAERGS
jgi:site-specific DNA-methyltransferase (adenine-specific)